MSGHDLAEPIGVNLSEVTLCDRYPRWDGDRFTLSVAKSADFASSASPNSEFVFRKTVEEIARLGKK